MHNCETIYSIRLLSIWECKYVILLMMKSIHFYMKFEAGYIVCTLIWLIWDTIFPKKKIFLQFIHFPNHNLEMKIQNFWSTLFIHRHWSALFLTYYLFIIITILHCAYNARYTIHAHFTMHMKASQRIFEKKTENSDWTFDSD